MHTALIGASKGIGRAAALELLLDPTNTVSLLLRTPSAIEADPDFKAAINQGRVRIVKGDANDPNALRQLLEDDGIDSVVSTLGKSIPNFTLPSSINYLLPLHVVELILIIRCRLP